MQLILASTSPYRKQLLTKLGLPFSSEAPQVSEKALADEAPTHTALRLAESKAAAVAQRYPNAWVIGSDQVAELNGAAMGKPGNHQQALAQLTASQGQCVQFHTGLCLMQACSDQQFSLVESYKVYFRQLSEAQLDDYLHKEQPYDCAGSFKSEGLGVCLFERLEGRDPNCLIGLPLIALCDLLVKAGLDPLHNVADRFQAH